MSDVNASESKVPATQELLDSLLADYKAGNLPQDAVERIDALREDFYASVRERGQELGRELTDDVVPGMEQFAKDLKAEIHDWEDVRARSGVTSEEINSDEIPIVLKVVDDAVTALEPIIDPVFDAVQDVVHSALDVAGALVDVRIENDPDGIYAEKLAASQVEMSDAYDVVDEGLEASRQALHQQGDHAHEAFEQAITEANEFHETHAPVRILMSTTVDPNLPEQIAEDTGQGEA